MLLDSYEWRSCCIGPLSLVWLVGGRGSARVILQ